MRLPEFVEAHTAFADTKIEAKILLKTIGRKKRMKIVKSPKDFDSRIWLKFPAKTQSEVVQWTTQEKLSFGIGWHKPIAPKG